MWLAGALPAARSYAALTAFGVAASISDVLLMALRRCTVEHAQRLLWLKMRPDTPQNYEYIRLENITGTFPFKIVNDGKNSYGKITLSKYMIRYATERFLDIEIIVSGKSGIKVPVKKSPAVYISKIKTV